MNAKEFLNEYKAYLEDTGHTKHTRDAYASYLRCACRKLDDLGVGFLEALAARTDEGARLGDAEMLNAALSDAIKNGHSTVPKKKLSDYKSAVAILIAFLEDRAALASPPAAPSIVQSSYTKKDLMKIFLQRLKTQDRYYDYGAFPVRIVTKIKAKRKDRTELYKALAENTKFLYAPDPTKFFHLKEITEVTIADGKATMLVRGKTYPIYTEVFRKGKPTGFAVATANGISDLSLDHDKPIHTLLAPSLAGYTEFRRLSDSVCAYRAAHKKMKIPKFSSEYFASVYEGLHVNENVLFDEFKDFLAKLSLTVMQKSYNCSKNKHV